MNEHSLTLWHKDTNSWFFFQKDCGNAETVGCISLWIRYTCVYYFVTHALLVAVELYFRSHGCLKNFGWGKFLIRELTQLGSCHTANQRVIYYCWYTYKKKSYQNSECLKDVMEMLICLLFFVNNLARYTTRERVGVTLFVTLTLQGI